MNILHHKTMIRISGSRGNEVLLLAIDRLFQMVAGQNYSLNFLTGRITNTELTRKQRRELLDGNRGDDGFRNELLGFDPEVSGLVTFSRGLPVVKFADQKQQAAFQTWRDHEWDKCYESAINEAITTAEVKEQQTTY